MHRDVKCENVLLSKADEPNCSVAKLADFGLAKIFNKEDKDDQFSSRVCGSPPYVAPEVLCAMPYGRPCDCWSLGVVTFVLLSGEMPFYAPDND